MGARASTNLELMRSEMGKASDRRAYYAWQDLGINYCRPRVISKYFQVGQGGVRPGKKGNRWVKKETGLAGGWGGAHANNPDSPGVPGDNCPCPPTPTQFFPGATLGMTTNYRPGNDSGPGRGGGGLLRSPASSLGVRILWLVSRLYLRTTFGLIEDSNN